MANISGEQAQRIAEARMHHEFIELELELKRALAALPEFGSDISPVLPLLMNHARARMQKEACVLFGNGEHNEIDEFQRSLLERTTPRIIEAIMPDQGLREAHSKWSDGDENAWEDGHIFDISSGVAYARVPSDIEEDLADSASSSHPEPMDPLKGWNALYKIDPERPLAVAKVQGLYDLHGVYERNAPERLCSWTRTFILRDGTSKVASWPEPVSMLLRVPAKNEATRQALFIALQTEIRTIAIDYRVRFKPAHSESELTATASSTRRKPGPKPNHEAAIQVAEIVSRLPGWRSKLGEIGQLLDHGVCDASDPLSCEADHVKIPLPRGWKKKRKDWLDPPDRACLVKAIEGRIQIARERPITGTPS